MALVKLLRFLIIVVYIGYLVNVGLLFALLPWSRAWGMLMTMFPPEATTILDAPWARGALSAFGVLHLLLVVWEVINPASLVNRGDASGPSRSPRPS
jgi:hypothetical protein